MTFSSPPLLSRRPVKDYFRLTSCAFGQRAPARFRCPLSPTSDAWLFLLHTTRTSLKRQSCPACALTHPKPHLPSFGFFRWNRFCEQISSTWLLLCPCHDRCGQCQSLTQSPCMCSTGRWTALACNTAKAYARPCLSPSSLRNAAWSSSPLPCRTTPS